MMEQEKLMSSILPDNVQTTDGESSYTMSVRNQMSKNEETSRGSTKQRYMERPVYDAANSATRLILLNNHLGKNTRLWRLPRPECNINRCQLIDPRRHQRGVTFFEPRNFHWRCRDSNPPDRFRCHSKLTSSLHDRPEGNRLIYEVRTAVNPRRHRSCQPIRKTTSMVFSPPKTSSSQSYVFEWERLYSEPPYSILRPASTNHVTKDAVKILPYLKTT